MSRAVAQNAAWQLGLDPTLLKKMLWTLAMMDAGYTARQRAGAEAAQPLPHAGGLGALGKPVRRPVDRRGGPVPQPVVERIGNSSTPQPNVAQGQPTDRPLP